MGISNYGLEQKSTVVFKPNELPAMHDGKYTLSLDLNLAIPNVTISDNTWTADYSFYINGPRFNLQPQDILSFYPPDLNTGDYATTLPTITLSRTTLPWERSSGSGNANDSWLALLVIDETEQEENGGTVSVSTMKLTDYIPQSDLLATDDPDSSVVVLSMSAAFASSILPAQAELQYLAHVRYTTYGSADAAEPRAIIMANRLPRPNAASVVYLVSVEGRYATTTNGNYLPAADPEQFPVLASWRFTSLENGLDFSEIASNLNCSPSTLQIPCTPTNDNDPTNPSLYLQKGYVPFPHTFRNGQSSVSWYHSPLTPSLHSIPFQLPAAGADSLLIYNKNIGMIDASYAAAWELGRQLAIRDRTFAYTLYKWKRENSMAEQQLQQAAADSHLPVVSKMDRRNQLRDIQQAHFRLNSNEVGNNNVFNSLVGENITLNSFNAPEFRKNDTFGQSVYTHNRSSNTLSFGDAMLAVTDSDFSVSFWFCTNNTDGNEVAESHQNGMSLISFNTAEFQTLASVTVTPNSINFGNSGFVRNLCDGEWHHLVFTGRDMGGNTIMTAYIDGDTINSISFATITDPVGRHRYYSCYLGSYGPTMSNGMFYGKIACLRLYSDVIESDDIRAIAESDLRGEIIYPFFNKLSLLHKVPFNYLVSSEEMLPAESIRFFQIDNTWINSLIDGAYSMGRISDAQYDQDGTAVHELGLFAQQEVMTGFILRSQLVSGWKDLLCDGYDIVLEDGQNPDDSNVLDIVRMERLSENILLCIFEGELLTLDLHIKRQSVHCGVTSLNNQNTGYTVNVRLGNGLLSQDSVSGTFKSLARTIDLSQLYSSLSPYFTSENYFNASGNAAFALEMIEGVPCVRIKSQNS